MGTRCKELGQVPFSEEGMKILDIHTHTRKNYTYIQPLGGHSTCFVLKSYVINAIYKIDWALVP